MDDFVIRYFESFQECRTYLRSQYSDEELLIDVKSIENDGSSFNIKVPRYFFRGESRLYPTTTSTMQRLLKNRRYNAKVISEIENVVMDVDQSLQEWLKISPMESAGYLQHYGLPTELLDITPDLDSASFFASYSDSSSDVEQGFFCVFDLSTLHKSAITIDLTGHRFALRPRIQNAYVFFHRDFIDIKSRDCIEQLNLKWYGFMSSKEEKSGYHDLNKYLPDNLEDPTAGFLYLCLTSLGYKVSDTAAQFISQTCNVPAVPIAINEYGELRTLSDTTVNYSETVARFNLHRILSNQYPDTANQGGLNPIG